MNEKIKKRVKNQLALFMLMLVCNAGIMIYGNKISMILSGLASIIIFISSLQTYLDYKVEELKDYIDKKMES